MPLTGDRLDCDEGRDSHFDGPAGRSGGEDLGEQSDGDGERGSVDCHGVPIGHRAGQVVGVHHQLDKPGVEPVDRRAVARVGSCKIVAGDTPDDRRLQISILPKRGDQLRGRPPLGAVPVLSSIIATSRR